MSDIRHNPNPPPLWAQTIHTTDGAPPADPHISIPVSRLRAMESAIRAAAGFIGAAKMLAGPERAEVMKELRAALRDESDTGKCGRSEGREGSDGNLPGI